MSEANVYDNKPKSAELEKGEEYFWCACGNSKNGQFCDGSHRGTKFSPLVFKAEQSKKVFFCTCKQTKDQPLCDGSHNLK